MYNYIYCPLNKHKFNINSNQGKKLLKNYIKYLTAGSNQTFKIGNKFFTFTTDEDQVKEHQENFRKAEEIAKRNADELIKEEEEEADRTKKPKQKGANKKNKKPSANQEKSPEKELTEEELDFFLHSPFRDMPGSLTNDILKAYNYESDL